MELDKWRTKEATDQKNYSRQKTSESHVLKNMEMYCKDLT